MLVNTYGATVAGVDAILITVEVSVSAGSKFFMVGLPDNAVRESKIRVETALKNTGYKIPGKKVVVNMAPADIKKEGSAYDLTIAVGILAAAEQIKHDRVKDYLILGEVSLNGDLKAVQGILPISILARDLGFKGIIIPEQNAKEASIVAEIDVLGFKNIKNVLDFLDGKIEMEPVQFDTRDHFRRSQNNFEWDFSDVKGQLNVKRALEIAAAGGHNVILIGPPGAGKTMLAKRMASILPPLNLHEALETTKIHSVAGRLSNAEGLIAARPFRNPHHTVSDVALVGGGSFPKPGEISLAHNGVLFLDELPEFKRTVLEVMRQPLEDRQISISRAKINVDYPASFMLIASMNPCPCGYYNHPEKECTCSPHEVQRYLNKVSGPLLDRIDLHVEVTPVNFEELATLQLAESSLDIRNRVIAAREVQVQRFQSQSLHCNAQMEKQKINRHCQLDGQCREVLKIAMDKFGLSARAYDRILKVARTIADLDKSDNIERKHIAEAIHYRSLDKDSWAN